MAFPHPVDEISARLVAAGAVTLALSFAATGWWPLAAVLAYGFAARVVAGPRYSPLGRLVTRVVRPRLPVRPRWVAGPPKRFAQGIGAACSATALVLVLAGAGTAARVVALGLAGAALLEAAAGLCLGCRAYAALARLRVVPECRDCGDLAPRLAARLEHR